MLKKLLVLLLTAGYVLSGYLLLTGQIEMWAADLEEAKFLLLWVITPVYCLLAGLILGTEWRVWWWLPLAYGAIYLCSCGFIPQLRLENENEAYGNLAAYGGATIAGLAIGANLWRVIPQGFSSQESQKEKEFWKSKGKLTKREKTIIKMRQKNIKQMEAKIQNSSEEPAKKAADYFYLYKEYYKGKNVLEDREKAIQYLCEAVKGGSAEALEALGEFNFNGVSRKAYERGKKIYLSANAINMGKKTLLLAEQTKTESAESGFETGIGMMENIIQDARREIAEESEILKDL